MQNTNKQPPLQLQFDHQPCLVQFTKGLYRVFILGGYYVKAGKQFNILVTDLQTKETIPVNEKLFKLRCRKNGQPAIKYFDFEIPHNGSYQVSILHFNDLLVKKSMLVSARFFQQPVALSGLTLLIE